MQVKGQGNDQARDPKDELPIDINYTKFADWLSDRQKIKADWRNMLRLIQQKVCAGANRGSGSAIIVTFSCRFSAPSFCILALPPTRVSSSNPYPTRKGIRAFSLPSCDGNLY